MTFTNKQRSQFSSNEITVRLEFDETQINGRNKEIRLLQHAFDRLCDNGNREESKTAHMLEICLVSGASGIGKSHLVKCALRDKCTREKGGFFLAGKFQQQFKNSTKNNENHIESSSSAKEKGETINKMPSPISESAITSVIGSFPAFVQALQDLCRQLGKTKKSNDDASIHNQTVALIKSILGAEILSFCSWIPGLQDTLGLDKKESTSEGITCTYARFISLYRSLLFALAKRGPIVLFLDDLQWCDEDSLELLGNIIEHRHQLTREQNNNNDENNNNNEENDNKRGLILAIAYRNDNPKTAEKLLKIIQNSTNSTTTSAGDNDNNDSHEEKIINNDDDDKSNDGVLPVTEIELNCFDENDVNEFVSQVMELDPKDTKALSHVIHRKTGGNCLYVRHFLDCLQEQNLISFSFQTYRWEWDSDLRIIKAKTDISDNIVDIVLQRVNLLDANSRRVFQFMGLLGPYFDEQTLMLVISSLFFEGNDDNNNNDGENELNFVTKSSTHAQKAIKQLEARGLVEMGQDGWIKFSHDRIHEAAAQLTRDEKEKVALHLKIGRAMTRQGENENEICHRDWFDLTRIAQLNKGAMLLNDEERVNLAKENYHASLSIKARSAFLPAAMHCEAGIALLAKGKNGVNKKKDMWKSHFHLSLELYMTAAECFRSCGKDDRCIEMGKIAHAKGRTVLDRVRSKLLIAECMNHQNRNDEGLAVTRETLRTLGEQFPSNPKPFHIAGALFKTKLMLRKWKDKSLENLSETKDGYFKAKIKALTLMSRCCWFSPVGAFYLPLIWLREVQLVLEHGMCPEACMIFGQYAAVLCHLGDIEGSYRFGRLSLLHWEKFGATDRGLLWVNLFYYQFCHHWRHPFHELIDPTFEAYAVGMRSGDTQIALFAFGCYGYLYSMSGLSLSYVERDLHKHVCQLKEYENKSLESLTLPLWQMVLNLVGDSKTVDPVILTGKAMNENVLFAQARAKNNAKILIDSWGYKVRLGAFFGRNRIAFDCLKNILSDNNEIAGHAGRIQIEFLGGIAAVGLAKSTGKRKYLRFAKRIAKKLEQWTKGGAVNCLHMLLLMKAEIMSLEKKKNSVAMVRRAYDKAIQTAGRSGFTNHVALANEKAGIFHLDLDTDYATAYLVKAFERYAEWGARGKTKQLAKHYPTLFDCGTRISSTTCGSSVGIRARSRHSAEVASQHKKIRFW